MYRVCYWSQKYPWDPILVEDTFMGQFFYTSASSASYYEWQNDLDKQAAIENGIKEDIENFERELEEIKESERKRIDYSCIDFRQPYHPFYKED